VTGVGNWSTVPWYLEWSSMAGDFRQKGIDWISQLNPPETIAKKSRVIVSRIRAKKPNGGFAFAIRPHMNDASKVSLNKNCGANFEVLAKND
jgi:hypothetical protein